MVYNIDGLAQDCSNYSVATELLHSCTKPSIYSCGVLLNGDTHFEMSSVEFRSLGPLLLT